MRRHKACRALSRGLAPWLAVAMLAGPAAAMECSLITRIERMSIVAGRLTGALTGADRARLAQTLRADLGDLQAEALAHAAQSRNPDQAGDLLVYVSELVLLGMAVDGTEAGAAVGPVSLRRSRYWQALSADLSRQNGCDANDGPGAHNAASQVVESAAAGAGEPAPGRISSQREGGGQKAGAEKSGLVSALAKRLSAISMPVGLVIFALLLTVPLTLYLCVPATALADRRVGHWLSAKQRLRNRRAFPRFDCTAPATVDLKGVQHRTNLINISRSGASVAAGGADGDPAPFERGSIVRVTVGGLQLTGTVIWHGQLSYGMKFGKPLEETQLKGILEG